MSKVTITIEDLPDGNVKITATPNFETIIKMDISGEGLTAAHTYGLRLMNEAMRFSKERRPEKQVIQIPKVRLAH